MECPKCKSMNLETLPWDTCLPGLERASMLWQASHPAHALATLLFRGGSIAAKFAFSTVHRCKGCGHCWRKWSL
jgi:hypothetical protein